MQGIAQPPQTPTGSGHPCLSRQPAPVSDCPLGKEIFPRIFWRLTLTFGRCILRFILFHLPFLFNYFLSKYLLQPCCWHRTAETPRRTGPALPSFQAEELQFLFIVCPAPFFDTSKMERVQILEPYLVIHCSRFPGAPWHRLPVPFLHYVRALEHGCYFGRDGCYFRNTYLSRHSHNPVPRKRTNRMTSFLQLPLLSAPASRSRLSVRRARTPSTQGRTSPSGDGLAKKLSSPTPPQL